MYYLNCFFIYSILGHLIETIITLLTNANFKSGILTGWWTPIYGIGAVIILFISNYFFKNLHMNRILETIIVFFVVSIILSFIELLGGVLIEEIFGFSFWDYTDKKYNIGKYISLEMTLIWGISSIVFIYLIHPLLKGLILKVPKFITVILVCLFIFDCTKTFISKKAK